MELTANLAQFSAQPVQVLQTAQPAMATVLLSTLPACAQLPSTQWLDQLLVILVRSVAQLASLQANVPHVTQQNTVISLALTAFA